MSRKKLISLLLGIIVICGLTLISVFAGTQADTGVSVKGKITSYNPGVGCTVQLLQAGEVKYYIETTPGAEEFIFPNVANGTYDLVISKPAHLDYTIKGIVVRDVDIDLSSNSNELVANISLVAGDINGDGCVDIKDVIIITSMDNYSKSPVEVVYEDMSRLNDFTYETTEAGITITGVKDKTKTEYTIPEGVIGIGDSAFSGCTNLTSITIPDSVASIGDSAFSGCSSLTTATIYPTNATFGDDVFVGVSPDFVIYSDPGTTAEAYATANGLAFAAIREIVDSGTCGDNLTWTLYDDGELVISGTGAMKNYASKYDSTLGQYITTAPWGKHVKVMTKLTLSEGVTSIGERAFYNCNKLTGDLVIPDSVTSIGQYAFYYCSGFTGDLVIGNSVETIGTYAFYECSRFTGDLVIGNSVTSIGNYAFRGCSGFTGDLVIPDSVTSIGVEAFSYCSGFTGDLVIPDSVTSIGRSAFSCCSGFTGDLVIPDSVTSIGYSAFSGCSGFTGDLVIPDSVTSIDIYAFSGCSGFTGDLVIPDSVTSIGSSAFSGCTDLTKVTVYAVNATIDSNAFGNTSSDLVFYGYPYSTTEVYAKANSRNFVEILETEIKDSGTCGDNLTWTLYTNGELVIEGEGAMDNYSREFDSTLSRYITTTPWDKYLNCITKLTLVDGVTSIGDYAFYGCKFRNNLVIPDSVTTIGYYAFQSCSGFTGDLVIPDSVTSIGDDAFRWCKGFTGNLVIGNSVTSIGSFAFLGCSGFTGELIIGNSVTSIGQSAFDGCSGFTGELVIGNSVTSIGWGAFSGCSGFTGELVIPDSVTSIDIYAFSGCSGFTGDLVIPDSVTSIGNYAFYGCTDLTKVTVYAPGVTLGSSVFGNTSSDLVFYSYPYSTTEVYAKANGHNFVEILETEIKDSGTCGDNLTWTLYTNGELVIEGEGAMDNYPREFDSTLGQYIITRPWGEYLNCITKLTLADGVTSIGDYAFYGCKFRNNLVIPDSVTTIGEHAFQECSGFTGDLIIPDSVTTISGSAFSGCSGFTGELVIPDSVTSIGLQAFSGCSGLTKATIYATDAKFDLYVFRYTSADFEIHGYAGSTAETYANAKGHKFVALP